MDCPTDKNSLSSHRWHVSRSRVTTKAPNITVGIASEFSWSRGYARWGIHLGAENNMLQNGYSRWSVGVPTELPGEGQTSVRYMDVRADTKGHFTNDFPAWLTGIGYALLRDVREPAERIIYNKENAPEWERVTMWRRMLLHRAAAFYGTDSSQYRGLHAQASTSYANALAGRAMAPLDVLPRWRHIQARIAMDGKPYEEQVIWRSIF